MKFQKTSPKVVLIASVFLLVACSKKSENSLNLSKIEQGKIKGGKEEILSKKNLVLSGNQEVPSNLSGATGQFDISYNKSTKMLKYTINWSGLTGPAAAAHIHGEAPAGTNQSVKHHIKIPAAAAGMYSDSVLVDEISI